MANIIKFPEKKTQFVSSVHDRSTKRSNVVIEKSVFGGMNRFVWVVTVLTWPVFKWVLSLDVLFQMFRMIYRWNASDIYADWNFLLHFSVLTAFTYYVSIYKPKGI
jgi:hypothetical protein